MSANLLELQEMLRNIDMGSVQKVASGQSGKAAQLLGMDELKRRGEQMQEAKANEAEQGMQQPPMVDQFLAASQQMMGQPAPAPPQMPPQMAQAMPPQMPPQQQGIGSMMPQAPMQQPQMPPQMPPRMMAGGGMVRSDLLKRPDVSNLGIVEYLMSTGMSREEAEARARSVSGEGQQLNVGGFIQRYAPGGTVAGGDAMEYGAVTDEEIEALENEEPGMIDNAIEWAKENPLEAAEYGLTGLLAIGTLPVTGLAGAVGVGAAALGRKLALKQLGKRALSFIKNRRPSARATRIVDKRINLPDTQLSPKQMAERAALIGKETSAVGKRYAAMGGLGALQGASMLLGDDEEEVAAMPEGDFPIQGPMIPAMPQEELGAASLQVEPTGQEDPPADDPSFMDKFKSGEFSDFFQFLTRTGLGLAAGKGENIGQDIAEASIGGMDYLAEMKQLEREQKRLDNADALRASADVRDQTRLEMDEKLLPARIAEMEARAERSRLSGGITPANAMTRAESLLKQTGATGYRAEDIAMLAELLVEHQSPVMAYEMYQRNKGIIPDKELSGDLSSLRGFMANG